MLELESAAIQRCVEVDIGGLAAGFGTAAVDARLAGSIVDAEGGEWWRRVLDRRQPAQAPSENRYNQQEERGVRVQSRLGGDTFQGPGLDEYGAVVQHIKSDYLLGRRMVKAPSDQRGPRHYGLD